MGTFDEPKKETEMKKRIVLFLIFTLAAICVRADTNTFVAGETNFRSSSARAISSSRHDDVEVRPSADGSVLCKKCECSVADINCREAFLKYGWWISIVIIASVLAFAFVMVFRKFAEYRWRVVSMGAFVALMATIALSTFMWMERVVIDCEHAREIFRNAHTEMQLSNSEAVLKAYDQLSGELSKWFAMFAILGAFFGLVLPVGSYFLQLKEINSREEDVDAKIGEKVKEFENEMAATKEKFGKDTEEINQRLWKILVVRSHTGLSSVLYSCKASGWKYSDSISRDILQELLQFLQWLSYVDDRKYATRHFRKLAAELKEFKAAIDLIPEWKNSIRREDAQTSNVRFDLGWCAELCQDDYMFVRNVLHSWGIKVLDLDTDC